jgi:hypothetical protein
VTIDLMPADRGLLSLSRPAKFGLTLMLTVVIAFVAQPIGRPWKSTEKAWENILASAANPGFEPD